MSGIVGRYLRADWQFFILKASDDCRIPDAPNQVLEAKMLCWVLDGIELDNALQVRAV